MYRVKAVREILPTYATTVTKASEFLVKDMGEDRWLCTLMVSQSKLFLVKDMGKDR